MLQRTTDGRYGLNAVDPSAGGVELYTILWDVHTAHALQAEFEADGRLARCVFTGAPMTGPFQGQSMAQLLGEAKNAIYNTELCRAFIGFQIPSKDVAQHLGREVGVKGAVSPMEEEEVSEEATPAGEAAVASSGAAAASSGEAAAEAAPRKRPGSHDESKKNKKLKTKKGQQSLFGYFSAS